MYIRGQKIFSEKLTHKSPLDYDHDETNDRNIGRHIRASIIRFLIRFIIRVSTTYVYRLLIGDHMKNLMILT